MIDSFEDVEKIRMHYELFAEWTGDDVIEFNLNNATRLERLYFDKALELNDTPEDAIDWVAKRMREYYGNDVVFTEDGDDEAITAISG